MELAIQALGLLGGMGPFGKGFGVVVGVLMIVALLRRSRTEEDIARDARLAKVLDDTQSDYDSERARRIAADQKAARYLDGSNVWCGIAHGKRNDQISDRQQHVAHEIRGGIAPLILPEIPMLPRVIENDEIPSRAH